jgi:hypothetical protein
MNLRAALICLLSFLMCAPATWAQDRSDDWRTFAEKLPPGTLVKVNLNTGRSIEGRLIQVTPSDLRILPKTRMPVPAQDIAFNAVQSIDSPKEGRSPGAKVLIGVAIVAAGIGVAALVTLLTFRD